MEKVEYDRWIFPVFKKNYVVLVSNHASSENIAKSMVLILAICI